MPVAYLIVPYREGRYERTGGALVATRTLPVDDFTAQIEADGGAWRESEFLGNRALVKVRSSAETVAKLRARWFSFPETALDTRLGDLPTSVRSALRDQVLDAGYGLEELGARFPDLADATIEQAIRFLLQRRRKPRYDGAGDRITFDGPEQPTVSLNTVELRVPDVPPVQGASPGFPETGVLDDFNRSDRSLNGDGIWASPTRIFSADEDYEITANQANAVGTGWGQGRTATSYDRLAAGKDGVEAFATLSVEAGLQRIWWAVANPNTTTPDGYFLEQATTARKVGRVDGGTETQLGASFGAGPASGDKIGVWHDDDAGGTIHVYRDSGSGWAEETTRTDTTYAAGFLGLENNNGDTGRFDDFGGGEVVAGGTPVSQMAAAVLETLAGAARPAVSPFEALAAAGAVASGPLEALSFAGVSASPALEALSTAARAAPLPVGVLGVLFETRSLSLETLAAIGRSTVVPIEATSAVVAQAALVPVEALVALLDTRQLPIEAPAGIVAGRSAELEALTGAASAVVHQLEALAAVPALAIVPWEARSSFVVPAPVIDLSAGYVALLTFSAGYEPTIDLEAQP